VTKLYLNVPKHEFFIHFRYTLSSSRFILTNPTESVDGGTYRCKTENTIGSILSAPAKLTFGCKYMYQTLI